jgi:excisionase family DNA binding protein
MEEILTVEAVASRLNLHQKTVLRLIREGRLRAKRIGKSYRILRSDFDAFSGADAAASSRPAEASPVQARATCVVDLPDISPDAAQRLASMLTASLVGREQREESVYLNTIYDPGARNLKVIVIAQPLDAAALFRTLHALLEALG